MRATRKVVLHVSRPAAHVLRSDLLLNVFLDEEGVLGATSTSSPQLVSVFFISHASIKSVVNREGRVLKYLPMDVCYDCRCRLSTYTTP